MRKGKSSFLDLMGDGKYIIHGNGDNEHCHDESDDFAELWMNHLGVKPSVKLFEAERTIAYSPSRCQAFDS